LNPINIGPYCCGRGQRLLVIAGPCVIETSALTLSIAVTLKQIADELALPLVFKASFDKANRTSVNSYRGPGLSEGLAVLAGVKQATGLPVTTDIHLPDQAGPAAEVCDLLQIPAFLARQTDLLVAAARTGRPVHVKKGQFLAPWDMVNVVKKIESTGNANVMLCERGASFGYNTLVTDMRSLPIMARTGCPVVFDATHSVQQPGGQGSSSGGQREFAPILARAAVSIGVAAVFAEAHECPDKAPSDGPNMIPLSEMPDFIATLVAFDRLAKSKPIIIA